MTRYKIKKGLKISTKKRGMVSNYITEDDLGGKALVKDLLENGSISGPSTNEHAKNKGPSTKGKK